MHTIFINPIYYGWNVDKWGISWNSDQGYFTSHIKNSRVIAMESGSW